MGDRISSKEITMNLNYDIIFDIDGTLIDSHLIDSEIYVECITDVVGKVKIDSTWSRYKNITDSGILMEISQDNELAFDRILPLVKQKFIQRISQCSKNDIQPINGGLEFFHEMKRHHKSIGIATGGWGESALLKLGIAGYDVSDINIVSCNYSEKRVEIMKRCKLEIKSQFSNTVYFGDGFWDLRACNLLGWNLIGIGEKLIGSYDKIGIDYNDSNILIYLNEFKIAQPANSPEPSAR